MMPHTIFHLCLPGTDAHQMHGGGDSGGSGDDLSYSELEQPTADVERKGEDVGPLVCVGIDDEESARSVQLMIFSSYMKVKLKPLVLTRCAPPPHTQSINPPQPSPPGRYEKELRTWCDA
eukprot:6009810-Prymnesium_polylepis.1